MAFHGFRRLPPGHFLTCRDGRVEVTRYWRLRRDRKTQWPEEEWCREIVERLEALAHTVEQTIRHLKGEIEMSTKDFYTGFDEEQQKRYAEEASQRWGEEIVAESSRRWNAKTPAEKNALLAENNQITQAIADAMDLGPDHPTVQQWIERWHQSINTNFYPCSLEIFEALGHGYVSDARFTATYEKIRPGMAAFMEQAMVIYVSRQRG